MLFRDYKFSVFLSSPFSSAKTKCVHFVSWSAALLCLWSNASVSGSVDAHSWCFGFLWCHLFFFFLLCVYVLGSHMESQKDCFKIKKYVIQQMQSSIVLLRALGPREHTATKSSSRHICLKGRLKCMPDPFLAPKGAVKVVSIWRELLTSITNKMEPGGHETEARKHWMNSWECSRVVLSRRLAQGHFSNNSCLQEPASSGHRAL